MPISVMIDAVLDRIRTLDPDHEYRALAAHVAVTSPVALERLAYEHQSSPDHEARRIAAVQLRVVLEFASKLRWLESVCVDPGVPPDVRVGLAGVLHSLGAAPHPSPPGETAALIEPALLFHVLLARLQPWIPPMLLALESEPVLELMQLGIPDYLHPLLRQRYENIWELFHGLRQLPPPLLAGLADPPRIDDPHLLQLIEGTRLSKHPCPPAPAWTTSSWVSPWLDVDLPRKIARAESSELTG
jgi:hypothetical protein